MFKLYNGCPNRELQEHWDRQDSAREKLDRAVKDKFGKHVRGIVVYYPWERAYSAFAFDTPTVYCLELTPAYYNSIEVCVQAALNNLHTMNQTKQ